MVQSHLTPTQLAAQFLELTFSCRAIKAAQGRTSWYRSHLTALADLYCDMVSLKLMREMEREVEGRVIETLMGGTRP